MVATLVDPQLLELGLRAVKMVAMADGVFDQRERKLLAAADQALRQPGREPTDLDALAPIDAATLARAVADPQTRTRVVQAQIIMAMMDGDVQDSEYAVIAEFAAALDVDEPRLKNLRQYMSHHYTLLKLDLNRRSEMVGTAVRHAYRKAGLRGAWKNTAPFLSKRFALDEDLAWKYRITTPTRPANVRSSRSCRASWAPIHRRGPGRVGARLTTSWPRATTGRAPAATTGSPRPR